MQHKLKPSFELVYSRLDAQHTTLGLIVLLWYVNTVTIGINKGHTGGGVAACEKL